VLCRIVAVEFWESVATVTAIIGHLHRHCRLRVQTFLANLTRPCGRSGRGCRVEREFWRWAVGTWPGERRRSFYERGFSANVRRTLVRRYQPPSSLPGQFVQVIHGFSSFQTSVFPNERQLCPGCLSRPFCDDPVGAPPFLVSSPSPLLDSSATMSMCVLCLQMDARFGNLSSTSMFQDSVARPRPMSSHELHDVRI
jgi:hypothetical protein